MLGLRDVAVTGDLFATGKSHRIRRPLSERSLFIAPSILFRDESPVRNRGDVVIGLFFGPLGQLDLFPWHFLVGNQAEEMRNEVQTRAALIVGAHNLPRCVFCIRDSSI